MSHWQRHTAGGRFLEPKTLHPDHLRVIAARRKIEAAKRLLRTWRAVAGWLEDEHKAGACCRLIRDPDFHPAIALIAKIEAAELPVVKLEVLPCPTCGGDHNMRGVPDCHGAPVAAVVTLAPGERVATPRKPSVIRTLSDYQPAVLAWQINHRTLMTEETHS